jgi:magnesium transporter
MADLTPPPVVTDELRRLEEYILGLVESGAWDQAAAAFARSHPADIATVIGKAPAAMRRRLFDLLDDDMKADVLAELESVAGAEMVETLSNAELSEIVEDMAPDDAADVLSELPDARSREVLALLQKEDSDDLRALMEYPEDTAGGIMTTDVVAMQEGQTVEEALKAIAYFDTNEPLYYANIVDADGRLVGYVNIWDMLRERDRNRPLMELVHPDVVSVRVDADQEDVARTMSKYDFSALPVVDHGGRLVGRVTADDVIDVMEEEASEDIFRLAGSDDIELEAASPLRSCMARLPWLFVTLVGGFLTSSILSRFVGHIAGDVLIMAAFVPSVLAMGGNAGIQASTLVVRRIAVGDAPTRGMAALLGREMLIGALMGVVCGVMIGAWAHHLIGTDAAAAAACSPLYLAAVVAMALFAAMTFAAVFGALVPMVLNRVRIDPAIASGPFVTIMNDIVALLIYFGVTVLLVRV